MNTLQEMTIDELLDEFAELYFELNEKKEMPNSIAETVFQGCLDTAKMNKIRAELKRRCESPIEKAMKEHESEISIYSSITGAKVEFSGSSFAIFFMCEGEYKCFGSAKSEQEVVNALIGEEP